MDSCRMAICVICVICETFPEILLINLREICGKSAYLRNLRETFFIWKVDADAPRRVPTVDGR